MKKKLIALVLILAIVSGSLFAAGAKEAAPTGKTNLVWALWDTALVTYYEPLINAYQAKNPNVTIEMLDLGSADFQTMLSTQLTGGDNTIDIISVKDIPGYSTMIRAGQLLPLNDYVVQEGIDTSVYGGIIDQITVGGKFYALPFRSDFWVVYYNKDVFDAAGIAYPGNNMTLKEYDALARKVVSGSGANKIYGAHYHTWRSAVQLFGVLDGKNSIVGGEYAFLEPTYQLILDEMRDGVAMDYGTAKTTSTHYSGVFENGSVAMLNMGSWFLSTVIADIKSGKADIKNWGIVKYPHPDGVAEGTTLGTITSLAVNAKSRNQQASLDFIKFVTGAEGAEIIASTGTIPAIRTEAVLDAISSMAGFPQDDASREALKVTKTFLEMPLDERSADIEVVLNANHDNIMTRNTSIRDGLAKMSREVQAILNR
ncbi:ABC transporter substrate-binding protein [Parasphaerochaeta coccoides]|uniref:sn-glycerol-3-phosphate-binding periplasmic protein UgpB n=1 Tax=Parasphaerochaeta coccoides (strain ATCC BAA-1237 / DSM 17374 / SPN1) TaxID=760011 RepID=F4GLA5_PARC1|nr:sugar ABC transporter substrate-binding protein [Parasphaerochaeta coccoides]AEC02937.1 carbohydrate ABC transporter substrate-binding protein, CUT1 family [Parasphaerochaeta coccoides DSM 17374]